jgi:bis(5'-nucleosidyl)-tetraphosphatase
VKTVRSAGIVVYHDNNGIPEYLLLLYPGGYWEYPKGKLEIGESNEMAAHRELKEETGLTAQLVPGFQEKISYHFKDRQGHLCYKEVTFFLGETQGKAVHVSDEHKDFRWLPFIEAIAYVGHDNARDLLQKAHAFLSKKQ